MKKIFFVLLAVINLYSYDAFITPSTLKNSLDKQNLVVIDISQSYKKSHIIGAVSFDVSTIISSGEYMPLVDKEELEDKFRDIGIDNNSSVVIYGRNTIKDIKNSAFLAFVLISHGFENVSILDGGYMGWVFDYDWFTTKEVPDVDDGDVVLDNMNNIVDINLLKDLKSITIVDARYPQKYYGISKDKNDKYIGHIPGAKNSHFAYKFLRDKTIRTQDQLNEIYLDGLGLNRADNIVVYGESALDAAVEWYIIYKQMGFKNAKLYYNSFTEYIDWELKTERFKWE